MGICVGATSRLALEVRPMTYHHHHHHHARQLAAFHEVPPCDPETQCGDPVEDRVVDPPPEPDPVLPWPKSRLNPARPYSFKWLQ
jgi:hypothetical protein